MMVFPAPFSTRGSVIFRVEYKEDEPRNARERPSRRRSDGCLALDGRGRALHSARWRDRGHVYIVQPLDACVMSQPLSGVVHSRALAQHFARSEVSGLAPSYFAASIFDGSKYDREKETPGRIAVRWREASFRALAVSWGRNEPAEITASRC